VCLATGWGLKLRVDGRHLVVEDGFGPHRRVRRYSKIHQLARLVIVGATGSLSLEVLRWCAGAGPVQVVVLDPFDGTVLSTSGGGGVANDPRIRRAQSLAMGTETGLEIARFLITTKLSGERQIATELGREDLGESIASLSTMIDDAESLEEIRQLEGAASRLHWLAWEGLELRWTRRSATKLADHWRRYDGRRSAITVGTARFASDPANALLNLSFRAVEAEGRLATLALGLDPGLGILHADMRDRDSFVLDLMEPCRPIAAAHCLRLIHEHTFDARTAFGEDARGVVRVLPSLAEAVYAAMPSYGAALAPIAEKIRDMLADASPYDVATPSILTRAKHKEAARQRRDLSQPAGTRPGAGIGQVGIAPRANRRQRPKAPDVTPTLPLPVCVVCGSGLPREVDRRRRRGDYCARCLAERRQEVGRLIRDTPTDRRGTAATRELRSAANAEHRLAQQWWELAHDGETFDREWYLTAVLPGLAGFTLTIIAKATGLSTSAASKIRSGSRVPSPRHWQALAELVGARN
jgi:CRISPR-associated protein Cas1